MSFECRQCGVCCMYLGDYIQIEYEVEPFVFSACCVSTGTRFKARIDQDKRDSFFDSTFQERHPTACPFLRPSGTHIVCTIHETRPPQCRAYRCIAMKIFSPDGTFLGTVNGSLGLSTDDAGLRKIWEQALSTILFYSSDSENFLARYVEKAGYMVK